MKGYQPKEGIKTPPPPVRPCHRPKGRVSTGDNMSLQCRDCFWKKSCNDSIDDCTDFKPDTEKTFIEELLLTIEDAYENDGTVYDIKGFVDEYKPRSVQKGFYMNWTSAEHIPTEQGQYLLLCKSPSIVYVLAYFDGKGWDMDSEWDDSYVIEYWMKLMPPKEDT